MELSSEKYWELRCRATEFVTIQRESARAVAEAKRVMDALMVETGLDPALAYTLDDATRTATPATPPE